MAKYLCDCHACTYKTTLPAGVYCTAFLRGEPHVHTVSGTCGKDFVFDCPNYRPPVSPAPPVQLSLFGNE
jgi:hypothetical protein